MPFLQGLPFQPANYVLWALADKRMQPTLSLKGAARGRCADVMPVHESQLERDFQDATLAIYEAPLAVKPPYRPTYFRRVVLERSGHQAASDLLATDEPSSGFTELYLRGRRLDLSIECLVLKKRWRELFL